jgi:2-polyprenyl-3-methyl-5-hydroxy-6-metoxy-1,4-benzoquinol methylase
MAEHHFDYPEEVYNTVSAEQVLPLLFDRYKPSSILDVGCGNGSWLLVAEKLGVIDFLGVDIQSQDRDKPMLSDEKFRVVNLEEPFDLNRKFDIVLCLEVAEHLAEKDAAQLIENLIRHSDLIVFSAAIPRQGGHLHLNEQEPAYWQQLFNHRGFNTYDEIRPQIWQNEKVQWWYRQNIFIAQRSTVPATKPSASIHYLVHPAHYLEKEEYRKMQAGIIYNLTKDLSNWKDRDQSIIYHLRRAIRLILSGKKS